ncbi:hypothetical protein [Chryseobacterium salivictor]|nr:hypothetical protein [Chryseobacterium salivictor]
MEEDVYVFSEEQLLKIKGAREQYERGEYFTAEEARKEMMKWFKEQE